MEASGQLFFPNSTTTPSELSRRRLADEWQRKHIRRQRGDGPLDLSVCPNLLTRPQLHRPMGSPMLIRRCRPKHAEAPIRRRRNRSEKKALRMFPTVVYTTLAQLRI